MKDTPTLERASDKSIF